MRLAVIGHVEHVTIAPVPALPAPGEIVHLDEPKVIAGGGGGIAFFQLARSDAEVHLFTAFGNEFFSLDVTGAMSAVPLVMYKFAGSGYENWEHLAWAGALLVTLFVLATSLVARTLLLRNKVAQD